MSPQKFTKMVKIVTVCASCLLILVIGIIIGQYVKLNNLKQQQRDLDAQIAALAAQRQSLEQGIQNRMTDAYLEGCAREQLGLIREGEILYIYQ